MSDHHRTSGIATLVRQFAEHNEAMNDDAETIAAKMIAAVLHWSCHAAEIDRQDGRKVLLAAACRGLTAFIGDVHTEPQKKRPDCYTLITVRTREGLWVSETGHEEMIQ